MRHYRLIIGWAVLSFALLQLYLLFIRKRSRSLASVQNENQEIVHENSYDVVATFCNVCHGDGVPVFLIDPWILHSLSNKTSKQCHDSFSSTQHFCTSSTVFGVLSKLWFSKISMLKSLQHAGFIVNVVQEYIYTEEFYDIASTRNLSPLRYVFSRSGHKHVIHLVVFYQRLAGYLWFSTGRSNTSLSLPQLNLPEKSNGDTFSGAINNIDLVKVTINELNLRLPRYPEVFLAELQHSKFIECNFTRAKLFDLIYGPVDRSCEAKSFAASAMTLLTTAKKALDQLGIHFWISSGTLLGWYRQCDWISYSKDVDIGIFIKDYKPQLIQAMEANGLALKHLFGKISDSYELSFERSETKLDIFFFYEERNYFWNGATQARTGHKFKYIFKKFALCGTQFLGLKVRVPCDTQTYLEANYGLDWFRPVRTWNWKDDPSNVRENGEWPNSERNDVIQHFG